MKDVVIFGSAQFAELAYVYLAEDSPYNVAAFTVQQKFLDKRSLFGLDVVPYEQIEDRYPPDKYAMFVAMVYTKLNKAREKIYLDCKAKGYDMISYISSKAFHLGHTEIGDNCFVFEANVIQPFTTIGNNVIIWSGNHIGHHSKIGDHCFIASHAVISGNCNIGSNCFIGVNATLRHGVTVANNCVIGAGALILRDTVENGVYKGIETEPMPVMSHELKGL
jgi:sugar O-acyltransferase (sialic acid O-acetyltransferase NeuD family)